MPFLHQAYIVLTYGIHIFRGILILNLSYRYLIQVPMVERGIESLNNYLMIEMPCIANCYMGGTSRIHPPEPHSTTNLYIPSTSMVETTITSSPPLSLSTSITTPPVISTLPIN
jgi:hypothetical protein